MSRSRCCRSAFALDPDRLARFQREAQVLASFNHPNIAAIYGFEEADGVHALVLELVEGPTLADRMAQGPIPLDEALPIARQIADALEAAHERGHHPSRSEAGQHQAARRRRGEGAGLRPRQGVRQRRRRHLEAAGSDDHQPAHSRDGDDSRHGGLHEPRAGAREAGRQAQRHLGVRMRALRNAHREAGVRGRAKSRTRSPAFSKSDPDWNALPADNAATIRRVLRRCLEKDPRRRFHDIADVRLDLEEPRSVDAPAAMPSVASRAPARERAAWALAALSLVSLIGLASYVALKPAPGKEVTRFQMYPPQDTVLGSGPIGLFGASGATSGSISPDGTRLRIRRHGSDPAGRCCGCAPWTRSMRCRSSGATGRLCLLVAGRQVDRVLRWKPVEADRRRRRHAPENLRRRRRHR